MANFRFQTEAGLWFNPNTNEGAPIIVQRDNTTEKAEVVISIVNKTSGSRIRFNSNFDKSPALVFHPGEATKSVNLVGITQELTKPTVIKVRIGNVSQGDEATKPSEVSVRLVKQSPRSAKEQTQSSQIQVEDAETMSTTDLSKLEKLIASIAGDVKLLGTRMSTLERQGREDKVRDEVTLDAVDNIDDDTAKTVELVQQILSKMGVVPPPAPNSLDQATAAAISQIVKDVLASIGIATTTPTIPTTPTTPATPTIPAIPPIPPIPATPTIPAPSPIPADMAAAIAQLVKDILVSAGVGTAAPTTKTATVIIDGVTTKLTLPDKPNCAPIPTTVLTPVEPKLKLVYEECGIPNPCGAYGYPVMAVLENGWKNTVESQPFPNTYDKVFYYKEGNRIFLQGNVTGAAEQLETSNKTKVIFRIPATCAPKTQQSFTVAGRTTNGGIEAVELIIYPLSDGSAIVYAQNEGIIPQTIAIVGNYFV